MVLFVWSSVTSLDSRREGTTWSRIAHRDMIGSMDIDNRHYQITPARPFISLYRSDAKEGCGPILREKSKGSIIWARANRKGFH